MQASGNADTYRIGIARIDVSEPAVVVADDTEILVILVYHLCEGMVTNHCPIIMVSGTCTKAKHRNILAAHDRRVRSTVTHHY